MLEVPGSISSMMINLIMIDSLRKLLSEYTLYQIHYIFTCASYFVALDAWFHIFRLI